MLFEVKLYRGCFGPSGVLFFAIETTPTKMKSLSKGNRNENQSWAAGAYLRAPEYPDSNNNNPAIIPEQLNKQREFSLMSGIVGAALLRGRNKRDWAA